MNPWDMGGLARPHRLGLWLRGRLGVCRVDRGATAAEYALMAAFIAAVIAGTVAIFGTRVSALFTVPPGTF